MHFKQSQTGMFTKDEQCDAGVKYPSLCTASTLLVADGGIHKCRWEVIVLNNNI